MTAESSSRLFSLPEYADAASASVHRAIHDLTRARSPLLSRIRSEPAESIPVSRLSDRQGNELELEAVPVRIEFAVDIEPLTRGDFGPLLDALDSAAEQQEAAVSKHLFASMSEITDLTGNKVDAGGKPISWDLIIDALEKMEIPFDEDGKMSLSIVMNPRDAARLEQIGPPTPAQQARHDAVLERKRAEWLAKKRQRRLK